MFQVSFFHFPGCGKSHNICNGCKWWKAWLPKHACNHWCSGSKLHHVCKTLCLNCKLHHASYRSELFPMVHILDHCIWQQHLQGWSSGQRHRLRRLSHLLPSGITQSHIIRISVLFFFFYIEALLLQKLKLATYNVNVHAMYKCTNKKVNLICFYACDWKQWCGCDDGD